MSDKASKIVYSAGDQEFFVIAERGMAEKWREDKTTPMTEVLQSFEVFTTPTGSNTGEAIHPSKGELENAFNQTNVDDIAIRIVEKGEIKNM